MRPDRPGPDASAGFRRMVALAVTASALIAAAPATAATIVVTRADDPPLADASGCSLRQAVEAANGNAAVGGCAAGEASLDTLELADSVLLTTAGADDANQSGDLDVLAGGPLRVLGTGAAPSVITQSVADRVLNLIGGTLTLERVVVTGGEVSGVTPEGDGGGILVLPPSRLTLLQATVSGNSAAQAGGIANGHRALNGPGSEVVITRSTVSENAATAASALQMGAGGISNINGTLLVVDSTVSGNTTAGGRGGGVYSEALFAAASTVNVIGSTVTGNRGSSGANLHNSGNGGTAVMRVRSTILSAPAASGNCGVSGTGTVTSVGFNLADDVFCNLTEPTDRLGLDPLLGPLVPGEAGTPVHVPGTGSPAIDRGTSDSALPGTGVLASDQRGLARTVDLPEVANVAGGDGTDIGSVEVSRRPSTSPPSSPAPVVTRRDTVIGLGISIARRLRLDRRRSASLRLTCPSTESSPPCRGTVSLRTRGPVLMGGARRVVVLATARFRIGSGRSARVRLRLTPSRARLVGRLGAARRAVALVTVSDGAGNSATARRQVQVVPPPV